ncbi:MAG: radical SAM protein [Thermoprotei archaeon]
MSNIAFGPVPSRRLGKSLGVNNVPAKHCSYNCVYCQLGSYKTYFERSPFYDPLEVREAVRKRIDELKNRGEAVDYVTFVPDGEPTLDANLGKEIKLLKEIGLPIAVLTNSSLLYQREVREELKEADLVSIKVDATTERNWRIVNRPDRRLNFLEVMEGVKEFAREYRGVLITETMLIDGVEENGEALARLLAQLAPRTAYLAVPTRPPAETWVKPARESQINTVYQAISKRLRSVELLIGPESGTFGTTGNAEVDLLSTLSVHPMRQDEVMELLRRDGADEGLIDRMLSEEKVVKLKYNNYVFYMKKIPSRETVHQDRALSRSGGKVNLYGLSLTFLQHLKGFWSLLQGEHVRHHSLQVDPS